MFFNRRPSRPILHLDRVGVPSPRRNLWRHRTPVEEQIHECRHRLRAATRTDDQHRPADAAAQRERAARATPATHAAGSAHATQEPSEEPAGTKFTIIYCCCS